MRCILMGLDSIGFYRLNKSDIKPPLLVVDPDRFYLSCEKFFLNPALNVGNGGEGRSEGEGKKDSKSILSPLIPAFSPQGRRSTDVAFRI